MVFIRHTDTAKEVDEETFFRGRESGGTKVSTALELMQKIIQERYPSSAWNIYGTQVSDGDNESGDSRSCLRLLGEVVPLTQYFAYLEVSERNNSSAFPTHLWSTFKEAVAHLPQIAMVKANSPDQIYPVLRKLFVPHEMDRGASAKTSASKLEP